MEKPRVILFSPSFQGRNKWDYESHYITGTGGSESNHIELSQTLAQLGHEVISFAPIPDDKHGSEYNGVKWYKDQGADSTLEGIWIIYRTLVPLDFITKTDKQKICIYLHDVTLNDSWTDERIDKIDKVLVQCHRHRWLVEEVFPRLKGKVEIVTPGADFTRYEAMEKEFGLIKRNPKSIMWASSPIRGLQYLVDMFMRAKEVVPDLSLDIFYGFDYFDDRIPEHNKVKNKILKYSTYPGINYRGKVGKERLIKEWLSHGMWVYPTMYLESFCQATIEAQAFGAIPIVNPLWGVSENTKFGNFVIGNAYDDTLVQARYVEAIITFANNPELQDEIRKTMMPTIREAYSWETLGKAWSEMLCNLVK